MTVFRVNQVFVKVSDLLVFVVIAGANRGTQRQEQKQWCYRANRKPSERHDRGTIQANILRFARETLWCCSSPPDELRRTRVRVGVHFVLCEVLESAAGSLHQR